MWGMLLRLQIDKGEIHATIDQANGMVAFHDNPEKFCTDAMAVEIDQQVSEVLAAFVCVGRGYTE